MSNKTVEAWADETACSTDVHKETTMHTTVSHDVTAHDTAPKQYEVYYNVVEDDGGGLYLYVYTDDDRETVIYSHSGYERCPGQLTRDIEALKAGSDPKEWEGCEDDPQGSWNDLLCKWTDDYGRRNGWNIIADEDGPIRAERMGAAGREEFYPEPYSKILESNGLNDCLWALGHGDDDAVLTCRLAALAFAVRAERHTDDVRVKELNRVNHLFLHGEESAATLIAARQAAGDAREAVGAAARAAMDAARAALSNGRGAVLPAATDAAMAAVAAAWGAGSALASSGAAAMAAGDIEEKEQMEILRALLAQMEDGPLQHVRNQTEESRMEAETPPEANLVDGEDDDSCAPRP